MLNWVDCKLSGVRGCHPPLADVTAGSTTMPYRIAMAVMGAEGKPLAKALTVRSPVGSCNSLFCCAVRTFCCCLAQGITVSMLMTHSESGDDIIAKSTVAFGALPDMGKLGQYIFSLVPFPPHGTGPIAGGQIDSIGAGHFIRAGIYTYSFRVLELPLPTKEFSVRVRTCNGVYCAIEIT
jgi:hypothetical protein